MRGFFCNFTKLRKALSTKKQRNKVPEFSFPIIRFLAWFLILVPFLTACSGDPAAEEQKGREPPSVPVTVARVETKDMPVQVKTTGSVEAYATVAVKSRVSGEIMAVHFREGQDVKEHDLLFTIDKAPFLVALKEAQANLERDLALARKAENDVRRNAPLVEKEHISRQTYEQLLIAADAARATTKADEAVIENLRLQLTYCSIKAPISGRTGSLLIQKGNLVKGNDENKHMVTINQIEPIYVSFTVPEQYIGEIHRGMAQGEMGVQVTVSETSPRVEPISGTITFMDNSADKDTGTIRLKGTFANDDRSLWPGQIVNVVLTLGIELGVVTVPSQAVQTGQSGRYAFVVNSEQKAELRSVVVNRTTNGDAIIDRGLRPGETVVTDGQLLLTPGTRVAIKEKDTVHSGSSGQ